MKNHFKIALKSFKYLAILFSLIYWIYIVIDDYIFIKKYGLNLEIFEIWLSYFFVYFLALTFYYWIIATIVILINQKLIRQIIAKNKLTNRFN
jgi:hypothetical protein